MTPPSTVPHKRKEPPKEGDFPPGTFNPSEARKTENKVDSPLNKGEYETGRITCESCGETVSFRDQQSGTFTVKHWDAHRSVCPNANSSSQQQAAESVMYTPEIQTESPSQPQAKRRRAKRTEEERIDYLRTDPYVAQFEAYKVLCASCDKWIRLRPNSTYCSIPWDAHRKSCLAKRVAKNTLPGDDRSTLFAKDPHVRKFDSERVQCKHCDIWINLGSSDNNSALQTWHAHRAGCLQSKASSSTTPTASSSKSIGHMSNVPPPSKQRLALASSALPPPAPVMGLMTSTPVASFTHKEVNPSTFSTQESRRRNAEQRAAALRSDPLIGEVEPNRVFCTMCQKWVQLRQDSSYCSYPWVQHRGKCMNRQVANQKRAHMHGELLDFRAGRSQEGPSMHDDVDSEEAESDDEDMDSDGRHPQGMRGNEKQKGKVDWREEDRRALLSHRSLPPALANAYIEEDEDAEGEPDYEYMAARMDLDSPPGRLDFAFRSVRYLFRTTYERSDELTIATLVTYLNAAMPPDKHEDFDTTEVTKAAMTLHERGDFVFEGDVIRLPY
ncbi:hypothetical protein C8Q75DRAFT_626390 [Abortiporus biennis]|nr:hypothetical protein C8Q75DRAFT_626390 [Abortiporus biennis]